MTFGVYGIFLPENYVYIGSTISDINVRFRVHKRALMDGRHDNTKLQELWDKYHTADFRILEEMDDKEMVREMEQHYIEQLQKEFTLCNEAPALMDGYALPDALRAKISKGRREGGKSGGNGGGRRRIDSFAPEMAPMSDVHKKNLELRKKQGW